MNTFSRELIAICRLFAGFERDTVCGGGVTIPQCVVLQLLLDDPLDVSSLAAEVGGSISAMTRLVDGLERRGWVERTRDPDDRRRVVIQLTPSGHEEATRLSALTHGAVAAVLQHIPEKKHAQCLASLELIREGMEAARDALDCC